MDSMGSVAPEGMSFGDALVELESIVAALEGGQLELEVGLERYERGVALLRALQSKLDGAQQRITTLMGDLDLEDESD